MGGDKNGNAKKRQAGPNSGAPPAKVRKLTAFLPLLSRVPKPEEKAAPDPQPAAAVVGEASKPQALLPSRQEVAAAQTQRRGRVYRFQAVQKAIAKEPGHHSWLLQKEAIIDADRSIHVLAETMLPHPIRLGDLVLALVPVHYYPNSSV